MRWTYNILFTLGLIVSAPFYFMKMWRRGNWRQGFEQRFGIYDSKVKQALTNRQVIWLHAVSVGEVNICTHLIKAIEQRLPNLTIVVSTTTSTGMKELERKLPSHVTRIYYPIDRRHWVNRAFAVINPCAVVLVEAEIWPNFLWRARSKNVPVFLANARLSNRSFRGYRLLGFIFRRLFRSFAGIGCQNEEDAAKLKRLGCKEEAIHVVGNLKYDAAKLTERRILDVPYMMKQLALPANARLIVAGSTHKGEEGILAGIYKRLRQRFPELFLVVVPRHQERGRDAGKEVADQGIKHVFRTNVTQATQFKPGEVDCLVVNTTGELRFFYEHASAVFVGKSLTAEGGQNPIEPAFMAKPIVFGKNMQNFTAISQALVSGGGALQVADAAELENALTRILSDPAWADELGQRGQRIVKENLGSVERTVDMIAERLAEEEIYVIG